MGGDVTELSEGDLKALPNSVLGHALRRRLAVSEPSHARKLADMLFEELFGWSHV